eukprot:GHVS01029724.1.p1 GENE.GHVS01029724.1~~GHVS01029724.1.p1  ORF type:complete len:746 (+),score=203.71 GHVS01029724.1:355-2592(+)
MSSPPPISSSPSSPPPPSSSSFNISPPLLLLLFLSLCLLPLPSTSIAPVNKHLAASIWPIAQHDNYAQASTLSAGPLSPGAVDSLFAPEVAGALTVLYTPDDNVVWGSSLSTVFKVDRSTNKLRLIHSVKKQEALTKTDTFRGIYSVLTNEGNFYFSSSNVICGYTDEVKDDYFSGIKEIGYYDFSPHARPMERVLALSLSYDGKLVFCTNKGGVGVVDPQTFTLLALQYATATGGTEPAVSVTNSIAIDEYGGVYIVTSKYMHRMWWDHTTTTLHASTPPPPPTTSSVADASPRSSDAVGLTAAAAALVGGVGHSDTSGGRSSSANGSGRKEMSGGSGIASTIISNTIVNRKRHNNHATTTATNGLVDGVKESEAIIAHYRRPQQGGHVAAALIGSYDSACADVAVRRCQIWSSAYPVDVEPIEGRPTKEGSGTTPSLMRHRERLYVIIADGQRNQEVLAIDSVTGKIAATAPVEFNSERSSESYTEQSILVSQSRLLVAQNALTAPGQRINDFLEMINAKDIVAGMDVPEFVQQNVYLLPVFLGDSPRGFQQFELVSTNATSVELQVTWTRSDVGCPNSIPTMSESTGTGVMYCVGRSRSPLADVLNQGMTAGWTIEAFDWMTGNSIFSAPTGSNLLYNSLYAATQIGADKEIIYGSIGGLVRLKAPVARSTSSAAVGGVGGTDVFGVLSRLINQGGGIVASAATSALGIVTAPVRSHAPVRAPVRRQQQRRQQQQQQQQQRQ